ncbi:hypothetical protein SEA_MABODAMACA_46 [Microbacterium phage Mabodamaca]|uniref:Uncharacterized protein n=1 Tax=Microbacterium phage Mabodamaca TaxID=3078574 RepID=A0AA96NE10_9CAUD|nr:hypothetical protein SEA_MABODAMACA_46 [Microbacterium phage Mabodamaca]
MADVPVAKLLVTERPFYRFGGVTVFLDTEEGNPPREGDTVEARFPDAEPDEDGDIEVLFGGRLYAISAGVLLENF